MHITRRRLLCTAALVRPRSATAEGCGIVRARGTVTALADLDGMFQLRLSVRILNNLATISEP